MSPANDNLGFSLNVDVQRAAMALTRFERSIDAVEKALHRTSGAGLTLDASSFEESIDAIQDSIAEVETQLTEAADNMGDALADAASQVQNATGRMASETASDLNDVNREIERFNQNLATARRQAQAAAQIRDARGRFTVSGGGPLAGNSMSGGGPPPGGNGGSFGPSGASGGGFGPGNAGGGSGGGGGGVTGAGAGAGDNFMDNTASQLAGAAVAAEGAATGQIIAGPMGAIIGAAGGAVTGHAIMSYVTAAVREQTEEYIRETNLSSRLAGTGERTEDFASRIHESGRALYFSRGETMEAADAMKAFARDGKGVDNLDVQGALEFARSFGMQAGSTADTFNRFAMSGSIRGGNISGGLLARELAQAIEKGDMRARAAEAMEAAATALDDVAGNIGNLSDTQRQSVMGVQTLLNASGQEMFRGQRGAQVIGSMNAAIRPDSGDDTHESMLNMALVKYGGMKNASPLEILKRREKGLSDPGNVLALSQMIKEISGGNTDYQDILLKQHLGMSSYTQAEMFRNATGGLENLSGAPFDAEGANQTIQRGLQRQNQAFDGRARAARSVEQQSEEVRRSVGSALVEPFRDFQGTMLRIGGTITGAVEPAFKTLNDWLHTVAESAGLFNSVKGQGYDNPGVRGVGRVGAGQTGPAKTPEPIQQGRVYPDVIPGRGEHASIKGLPSSAPHGVYNMQPEAMALALEFHKKFGGTMTSGWRDEAENKAAGGVPNSYHMRGQAFDFVGVPANKKKEIEEWAKQNNYRSIYHDAGSGYHYHLQPNGGVRKGMPQDGERRKPEQHSMAPIEFKQIFYVNGGNPDEVRRQAAMGAKQAIAAHEARASTYMGA